MRVEATMQQVNANDPTGVYFANVLSTCPREADGLLTAELDPPMDFGLSRASQFALDGSYPNPTRSASTVSFALDEATPVTLAVYDVMGRKVATLIDAPMDAGQHEVRWDGRSTSGAAVASGVYLLRLQAGEKIATRRLTVVK
jgi:phospholipase/lecithinase/hemolysin